MSVTNVTNRLMKTLLLLLLLLSGQALAQKIVEYQSDEYEVSNHHKLEEYEIFNRTTIFTLDFSNHEYSYSQKNSIGNWKVTTYRIKDFLVDDEGNGTAIIYSGGLEKIVMNDFKKTITFEFFDGGYCEFLNVRKIR